MRVSGHKPWWPKGGWLPPPTMGNPCPSRHPSGAMMVTAYSPGWGCLFIEATLSQALPPPDPFCPFCHLTSPRDPPGLTRQPRRGRHPHDSAPQALEGWKAWELVSLVPDPAMLQAPCPPILQQRPALSLSLYCPILNITPGLVGESHMRPRKGRSNTC